MHSTTVVHAFRNQMLLALSGPSFLPQGDPGTSNDIANKKVVEVLEAEAEKEPVPPLLCAKVAKYVYQFVLRSQSIYHANWIMSSISTYSECTKSIQKTVGIIETSA